jgi:hypothetical protein
MFDKLPEPVQTAAKAAFDLFCRDPSNPALERHFLKDTKKGRHKIGSVAVSVTRRYRAIYVEDGGVNIWYWIGSHEAYNNYTGKI